MHHHCINDTKSDQEIVLHELAMIGKWFLNGYVPSQIDVYTYINGDAKMPLLNMTIMWGTKLMVEHEGTTEIKAHEV